MRPHANDWRRVRPAFLICALLAGLLPAQHALDITLPNGARAPTGGLIAHGGRVAWLSTDRVWHAGGLTPSAVASGPVLPPSLWPAGPQLDLGEGTLLFQAVGPDGYAETGDDHWVLVRAATSAPIHQDLGPRGVLGTWTVWSGQRAARVDAAAGLLSVLDLSTTPATLTDVVLPFPVSADAFRRFGFTEGGRGLIGTGPGPDGTPGSADDLLVRIEGLESSPPQPVFDAAPLGFAHDGFLCAPGGAAIAWAASGDDAITATVYPADGAAASVIGVGFPDVVAPPGFTFHGAALVADEDLVALQIVDDLPVAHRALLDLSATPAALTARWTEDWNGGEASVVLGPRAVARFSGMGPQSFELLDFRFSTPPLLPPLSVQSFSFQWFDSLEVRQLGDASIVATASSLSGLRRTLVIEDWRNGPITTRFIESGAWYGQLAAQSCSAALGWGLAANLADDDGLWPLQAETLRLQSVPGVHLAAESNDDPASAINFNVSPRVIEPNIPLVFDVSTAVTDIDTCWLAVGVRSPFALGPGAPMGPGHSFHLDLAQPISLDLFPIPDPSASVPVDLSFIPPYVLNGQEWTAQIVARTADDTYLSSAAYTLVLR